MGLRHFAGSTVNNALQAMLSARFLPLFRAVPFGFSPWYDVQRISGSRNSEHLFDVGANVGQTASELTRFFPGSRVHCFEPASEPFEKLRIRANHWRNVRIHKLALGREASQREMHVSSGANSELNTLIHDSQRSEELVGRETVNVSSVDAFCEAESIDHVNVLKMDVQGWELEVLAGAGAMLSGRKIDFIFAEASFDWGARDMLSFETIHSAIVNTGYVLSGFYHPFRWGNKAELLFCDCLYTRQELALR